MPRKIGKNPGPEWVRLATAAEEARRLLRCFHKFTEYDVSKVDQWWDPEFRGRIREEIGRVGKMLTSALKHPS